MWCGECSGPLPVGSWLARKDSNLRSPDPEDSRRFCRWSMRSERGEDSISLGPAGNQVEHAGRSQVNVRRSSNSGFDRSARRRLGRGGFPSFLLLPDWRQGAPLRTCPRHSAGDDSKSRPGGFRGDDGPDDARSVAVVLRLIRGGDGIGQVGSGDLERDVSLHPASPDPTFARPEGPAGTTDCRGRGRTGRRRRCHGPRPRS